MFQIDGTLKDRYVVYLLVINTRYLRSNERTSAYGEQRDSRLQT